MSPPTAPAGRKVPRFSVDSVPVILIDEQTHGQSGFLFNSVQSGREGCVAWAHERRMSAV